MKIFSTKLIKWYNSKKRDLPWRKTRDPYKIWISEIILQQTRVSQGLDYYNSFIEKFPDVASLAKSSQEEVLLSWQGLGYYSRARNLHQASKQIVSDFDGKFPHTFSEIISLKGVGDYTASAIASFAFELVYPVIDGNVLRFISRYKGIKDPINIAGTKGIIKSFLQEQIKNANPATFNQALMEFGALQCIPRNPDCSECPFHTKCIACKYDLIASIPNKDYKIAIKNRYFNYILAIYKYKGQYYTFLNQRHSKDIWQGLHEFILNESDHLFTLKEVYDLMDELNVNIIKSISSGLIVHKLSHRNIKSNFFVLILEGEVDFSGHFSTKFSNLSCFAFPRLISKFLTDYEEQIKKLFD